jgi:hypothetical protein
MDTRALGLGGEFFVAHGERAVGVIDKFIERYVADVDAFNPWFVHDQEYRSVSVVAAGTPTSLNGLRFV